MRGRARPGVTGIPELQWDIESLRGQSGEASAIESGNVADHGIVTLVLACRHRQSTPDVQPVAVLLVDLLATDLQIHVINQSLTHTRHPLESFPNRSSRSEAAAAPARSSADQISVAAHLALALLAEVRLATERLLNRLDRKVRMPPVHHLEKRDLRVPCKINVLCP